MLIIFCEGIGDQIFIADFIEKEFQVKFDRQKINKGQEKSLEIKSSSIEIKPIDGCKQIHRTVIKELFINNSERGGKNILIFDADYEGVNGNNGFQNCNVKMDQLKNHPTNPIDFTFFLWPDNKSDGLFENLLEKIVPSEKEPIVSCIQSNLSCLNILKDSHNIKVPGIKEKINSYLHLHAQSTKPIDRSYISEFWNLEVDFCEELRMFKQFLSQYISN